MKTKALSEPKQRKAFRDKYLAAVLAVAALLISSLVSAQTDSLKYSQINGYGFKYKRMAFDSVLMVPLSTSPHAPYRMGALRYKASDSTLQLWTGYQWNSILTGVGNGVDTAYAYDDSTLAIETPNRDYFIKIKGKPSATQLNDSTFIVGDDTITIHGTGGTSITLNNIGTGYALLATPGGNFKRINPGYGVDIDSTTTANTITVKADTSSTNHLVTQSDLNDAIGGVSGTPGGSNTQIQYNNSGAFAGDAGLTYDATTNSLTTDSAIAKRLQLNVSTAFTRDSIVLLSDSYGQAAGASAASYGFAKLLADHLQLVLVNKAVSGSTLMKRSPVDPYGSVNLLDRLSDIPTKTARHKYIVCAYGLNDVGYNGANYTAANFSTDYRTVLDNMISKGWAASEIILVTPWYISDGGYGSYASTTGTTLVTATRHIQFVDTVLALASQYGTMVFDIYRSQAASGDIKFLSSDAIHPYNTGHAFIASQIASYVNYTVLKNGQAAAVNGVTELQRLRLSIPDTAVAGYQDRILSLDSSGMVRVQKTNSVIRNNFGTTPDASQIFVNGKIMATFPASTPLTTTDIERIITDGGVKGAYLRANGSLPGGMVGNAVEIGLIGSLGYIGTYNRTSSSSNNISINGLGGNILLGTISNSGSNLVQVNGNLSTNSRLRVGDHNTPTVALEVGATDAMLFATGTTAQRPSAVLGYHRVNSDSAGILEGYNTTATAYELYATRNWVRSNFGSGGNGIYGGSGSLPSDVTVTGGNNSITFDDIFAFRINSDYNVIAKANGTGNYTEAVVGAGNIYEIGYTPTAGTFSKGAGVFIDTNNNIGLGTAPPTTMPLYSTGSSTFIQGLQSNHGNYYKVSNQTADFTASLQAYFYTIDATSGNVTVTLPAASTAFGNTMGITYKFQRTDNSGNTVTIQRAGSDVVNGATSVTISGQYSETELHCTSTSSWAANEVPKLSQGTWTPTLSNITNTSSSSVAGAGSYMRVGNTVTFSVELSITPTSGASQTQVDLTLPIASAFANSYELSGTCSGLRGRVVGQTANDRASVIFVSDTGSAETITVHVTYRII